MSDSSGHSFERKLVCVKYPGIVSDDEKMLETLGGLKNISNIFGAKNRRLGLHFRPDDPHSKAVYGDREKVAGLLLRVRVPRNQRSKNASSPPVVTYTVLGCVNETFIFKSLCDFQYLPQTSGPEGDKQVCMLKQIFPTNVVPPMSWLNEPNETLFLLPPALSRMDAPNPYCYRTESADANQVEQSAFARSARLSRKYFTQRITFDEKMTIPTAPLPAAVKEYKSRKIGNNLLQLVKEMFEKRPIWSKVALQIECPTLNANCMRYLLPCVAYYFMSGPWRLLWVRFGYNPLENPEARVYQLMEYRVQSVRLRTLVKTRNRARTVHLPHSHQKNPKGRRNFITSEVLQDVRKETDGKSKDLESYYKFKKGVVPAHRNMLYQFIDIDLDEIKNDLMKEPGLGSSCHERFGWFSSDLFDRTRKIIDEEATRAAISQFDQARDSASKEEEEALADSSDSEGSSLVVLSSSEGESDPEPEYEVDDSS